MATLSGSRVLDPCLEGQPVKRFEQRSNVFMFSFFFFFSRTRPVAVFWTPCSFPICSSASPAKRERQQSSLEITNARIILFVASTEVWSDPSDSSQLKISGLHRWLILKVSREWLVRADKVSYCENRSRNIDLHACNPTLTIRTHTRWSSKLTITVSGLLECTAHYPCIPSSDLSQLYTLN